MKTFAALLFCGICSSSFAWFFPSSGRQEAESPIDPECIQKAALGSCEFYTCFDIRHPCDSNNYALTYGWRFCNKFDQNYDKLDLEGQRWFDEARICSMESMVPFYNDKYINCEDVEAEMINNHGECEAAGGLCSVSLIRNNSQVFEEVYGTNQRSANRLLQAMKHCGTSTAKEMVQWLGNKFDTLIPNLKETFNSWGDQIKEGVGDLWDKLPF